ncbi:MAG: hypothetical protein M3Q06_09255 [Bacteroidota bacterium]|nr:hypothetical protein [Bacteroidota bacterium]
MNTKELLLENILVTPAIEETIAKVDFNHLEDFVTERFSVFASNRGLDTVKYDLNYDVQTPTDAFLSNLMEEGSVLLLQENGLLHDEQFIDALYIIISAMNIVVAECLRRFGIANVASYRYFDADPQYILLERAVEQVEQLHPAAGYAVEQAQSSMIY